LTWSYLDHEWLRTAVDRIFPAAYPTNFECAVAGLAYATATRPIYGLLVEHGIVESALGRDLAGRHAEENLLERVALAYLWGDEEINSPRLSLLFQEGREEELGIIAKFFWSLSNQSLSDEQKQRILVFWEECAGWISKAEARPAALLSTLSLLTCYLDVIGPKEQGWLIAVAPHVGVEHNADYFVEELERLAEKNPDQVSVVLGQLLQTYAPPFDFRDRFKRLLIKLADRGKRSDAIQYAEQLRNLPGMMQVFDQLTGKV
jgi:hypothetical protein